MNKIAESIEEILQAYLDGKIISYDNLSFKLGDASFPLILSGAIETGKWSIKDRTININGFEVPEPYRGEMENGQIYWFPSTNDDMPDFYEWEGDDVDKKIKENGLLHLSKEAAQMHLKALISFTKMED